MMPSVEMEDRWASVEMEDLPGGRDWQLARETASAALRDAAVEKLIADELVCRGVDPEVFWAELARRSAVLVHSGDVRRARRLGFRPHLGERELLRVNYEPYKALRLVLGDGRFVDVVYRRASQESGR